MWWQTQSQRQRPSNTRTVGRWESWKSCQWPSQSQWVSWSRSQRRSRVAEGVPDKEVGKEDAAEVEADAVADWEPEAMGVTVLVKVADAEPVYEGVPVRAVRRRGDSKSSRKLTKMAWNTRSRLGMSSASC